MSEIEFPEPSVEALRYMLKEKLKKDEPLPDGAIAKVNTFSRTDLMKEKTRELVAKINDTNTFPEIHEMLDTFDLLAMDWVYGNQINWTDSLADKQAKKILLKLTGGGT